MILQDAQKHLLSHKYSRLQNPTISFFSASRVGFLLKWFKFRICPSCSVMEGIGIYDIFIHLSILYSREASHLKMIFKRCTWNISLNQANQNKGLARVKKVLLLTAFFPFQFQQQNRKSLILEDNLEVLIQMRGAYFHLSLQ